MILTLSDIKINVDFENLIPKQTADQFKQMEENMLAEGGAHDPLVIWQDHDILLDGHHRLRVLKAHPELQWYPKYVTVADETEAKEWIIKTALGKRNLTPPQWQELVGRLYKARKSRKGSMTERGDDGRYRSTKNSDNGERKAKGRVTEQIAEELGINRDTVMNAANYVDGLDAAEKVIPGISDRVRSGELLAQKAEVRGWRKMTPEQIKSSEESIKERGTKKRKSEDAGLNQKIREAEQAMYSVATVRYGLPNLLTEIDALGDSFIGSLDAKIKRRAEVIASYDGGFDIVIEHIDTIIEKLNDMKKGFRNV